MVFLIIESVYVSEISSLQLLASSSDKDFGRDLGVREYFAGNICFGGCVVALGGKLLMIKPSWMILDY